MALVECQECHRRISDRAVVCPQCGRPREVEAAPKSNPPSIATRAGASALPPTSAAVRVRKPWLQWGLIFIASAFAWPGLGSALALINVPLPTADAFGLISLFLGVILSLYGLLDELLISRHIAPVPRKQLLRLRWAALCIAFLAILLPAIPMFLAAIQAAHNARP